MYVCSPASLAKIYHSTIRDPYKNTKKMFNQDEEKNRMGGWKQGDMFLAGQGSQDCFDSISDIGICGIYLSLALGTVKFKQLD